MSKTLDLKICAQIASVCLREESSRGVFLRNNTLIEKARNALADYSDQLAQIGESFRENDPVVLNAMHESDRVRAWKIGNVRRADKRVEDESRRIEGLRKISASATF